MDSLFADFSALSSMSGEKAEKNMQEALNYLGLDMRNIARTMRPYHPLEMLKMAAWEERRVARLKGDDEFQKLYAHLLPVLTQSVLQSTLYDTSYPASTNRDIKQKDWSRLRRQERGCIGGECRELQGDDPQAVLPSGGEP